MVGEHVMYFSIQKPRNEINTLDSDGSGNSNDHQIMKMHSAVKSMWVIRAGVSTNPSDRLRDDWRSPPNYRRSLPKPARSMNLVCLFRALVSAHLSSSSLS